MRFPGELLCPLIKSHCMETLPATPTVRSPKACLSHPGCHLDRPLLLMVKPISSAPLLPLTPEGQFFRPRPSCCLKVKVHGIPLLWHKYSSLEAHAEQVGGQGRLPVRGAGDPGMIARAAGAATPGLAPSVLGVDWPLCACARQGPSPTWSLPGREEVKGSLITLSWEQSGMAGSLLEHNVP